MKNIERMPMFTIATIVLAVLKLTGVLPGLTWLAVFTPMMIGAVLFIVLVVTTKIILFYIITKYSNTKSRYGLESTEPMYWDPVTKQFYDKNGPIINNFEGDDYND